MSYRAGVGLSYPHPDDLPRVRRAGGLSALARQDAAAFRAVRARLRTVAAGEACDDVPPEAVAGLVRRGLIVAVPSEPSVAGPRPSIGGVRAFGRGWSVRLTGGQSVVPLESPRTLADPEAPLTGGPPVVAASVAPLAAPAPVAEAAEEEESPS